MAASYEPFSDDNQLPYTDKEFVRPRTYYGDGTFDAESSVSSDEGDALLMDKPGPVDLAASELGKTTNSSGKRPTSIRYLVITLGSLVSLACLIGVFAAHTYVSSNLYGVRFDGGARKITLDDVFNGTFAVSRTALAWVPEAGDGVFSASQGGSINLVDLKTNKTTSLLATADVKDEQGNSLEIAEWSLSSDMKYVLVKADYVKQWRHSSFGNYYIYDVDAKTTKPLITPSNPPVTAYATWSPTGQGIAYVNSNDLYLLDTIDSEPVRITTNGSATVFNAVPDWVYEEEVFGTDYALWFSPTSRYVAYCTFDETEVAEFKFPIYNPTDNSSTVNPYTEEVVMRYPKPGYKNPLVGIWIVDTEEDKTWELGWEGRHTEDDSIIFEVTWVDDEKLIVKEVNRNADDGNVVFFDFTTGEAATGTVTRKLGKNGEEGDDGWIESTQFISPLPDASGYLDIIPTKEGYTHIALFSPVNATEPVFLTSGDWEVTSGILGVDEKNVYFAAANPLSTGRHVYSVALPTEGSKPSGEITALTAVDDDSGMAYYNADFSPEAGFLLLSYEGPGIPWQRVVEIGNESFDYVLNTNEALTNVTQEFEAPTVLYTTITIDGFELNVKEMRPPHFDDSGRTKYAVMFRVYGGPNSQTVDLRFSKGFDDYVVCSLGYIIVIVDGRGTGFKGRELRNQVKSNLGFWETYDQIEAAKMWAAKDYVDNRRIGIWGWSYGGFMASKIAEADAGVHTLAMAVAPVTSWRLYDSIYTERYMNLPELNEGGYINASISHVEGFKNIDYLLAHGSGDDNVHYANSAHLLDMFTQNSVRDYRFRMFPDSDHSITKRGANREVYEFLASFLVEKWRKGGRNRGW